MPLRREPDTVSPRALARVRGGGKGDRDDHGGRHRPLEVPRGPVIDLPLSLQGARWMPSRSAVAAVLAVVALVAVVFGARVWLTGAGEGAAVGTRASVAAGPGPSGVSRGTSTLSRASPSGSSSASPSGGDAAAALVIVHVVGQVAKPGVYRLRAGVRVGDAVTAAGGATRAADLAAVNLARVLVDGEQIVVPKPGEVVAAPGGAGSGGAGAAGSSGSAGSAGGGKVALNSADLTALETLPGVGPVLAQRILDWRTEHGRFTTIDELGEVSGIGEKVLAQLTPKVTL